MKDMPEEAQRIQRGRDDIRVMVRYPRKQRQSLGSLENMRAGPGACPARAIADSFYPDVSDRRRHMPEVVRAGFFPQSGAQPPRLETPIAAVR